MIAYIDSSVLLRVLLKEENRLKDYEKVTFGISSILIKIECMRTLDRLKNENQLTDEDLVQARSTFQKAFKKLTLVTLSKPVVEIACQPWGLSLKSLDAIHLASALAWKRNQGKDLFFLTHDQRLSVAARANEFQVLGT